MFLSHFLLFLFSFEKRKKLKQKKIKKRKNKILKNQKPRLKMQLSGSF